jgi:hypothetical protein
VNAPLTITVTGKDRRVLAKRTFKGLFFTAGRVVKAVLVPNAACEVPFDVEVSFGTERKKTSVALGCGE